MALAGEEERVLTQCCAMLVVGHGRAALAEERGRVLVAVGFWWRWMVTRLTRGGGLRVDILKVAK